MSILTSAQAEQEAILTAAKLIMAAVTTSPHKRKLQVPGNGMRVKNEKSKPVTRKLNRYWL